MVKYIPLILGGVLLNACAQLFLKKGMLAIGHFEFSAANVMPVTASVATNAYIIFGLLCYVVSVTVWMLVLSRVDVSFAYPFLSIGYVVTAAIGYAVFHESLTAERLLGIGLICAGVLFVARSGQAAI